MKRTHLGRGFTVRDGHSYAAALINFPFLAHALLSTDEVVKAME